MRNTARTGFMIAFVLTLLAAAVMVGAAGPASRTADINAGAVSGNVLVIAASTSDTTPDDEFKISQIVLTCQ